MTNRRSVLKLIAAPAVLSIVRPGIARAKEKITYAYLLDPAYDAVTWAMSNGKVASDLTLDHILPRHRGGLHTWDNLVAACKPCNHRKGGKTPEEARVRLLRVPFEPRSDLYSLFTPYLADERNEAWRNYLFLGRN